VRKMHRNCGAARGLGREATSSGSFSLGSRAGVASPMGSPLVEARVLCSHPLKLLRRQRGANGATLSSLDASDDQLLRYGEFVVMAYAQRQGRLNCWARHASQRGTTRSSRFASGSSSDSQSDHVQRVARRSTRASCVLWLESTARSPYPRSRTLEVLP